MVGKLEGSRVYLVGPPCSNDLPEPLLQLLGRI
jgi:hypothetical protein